MDADDWQEGAKAAETKRVARLLDIIARISARPKFWTRHALAQTFEISERQVQEDLAILKHGLLLPIEHCKQGYYFTRPQVLPSVTFAFGEAMALLLAAQVGQAMAGVDGAQLAAALSRLQDAFSPALRRLVQPLCAALPVETGRRPETLELLQEAIATHTTVEMRYATASRQGEESERAVDPYALVPYVRSFHLVAYCHQRGEVRIFKADRIGALRLTTRHFEPPADFDLRAYLSEGWGLMRGAAGAPEEVRIRFVARAGRWVAEEKWHPGQTVEWQPDGSLIFALRVGITPALVRWVLYYGAEATVLQPAWLADEVRREAAQVAQAYDGDDGSKTR